MIIEGDCLEVLLTLPDRHVDAVVTDPPYELGFMGRAWDASGIAYSVDLWREVLRVCKPGTHLLAFGGTRTYHRMACAIEDAGFEVRDSLHWIQGQGFPKSLDVSKAIDQAAGAEREIVGPKPERDGATRNRIASENNRKDGGWDRPWRHDPEAVIRNNSITAPATDAAKQWDGWGTALKPAHEPIVLARKPLEGTVAENVQAHGTGALNIDGCRIRSGESLVRPAIARNDNHVLGRGLGVGTQTEPAGRWPPNILLTCCGQEPHTEDCAVAELDRQCGILTSGSRAAGVRKGLGYHGASGDGGPEVVGNSGGGSRFFPVFRYEPKASRAERGEGNTHPTVKPVALMRWLCRLITPPGGLILDMFAGSGTTGVAANAEGFRFIGIEKDPTSAAIARRRLHMREPDPEPSEAPKIAPRKQLDLFMDAQVPR